MARPEITAKEVQLILPQVSNIRLLDKGGQKVVFTCIIEGKKYALKFLSPNLSLAIGMDSESLDDVTARAHREVETMNQCSIPYLVRMGPIGLETATINGQQIIYFSEEFIEGLNLQQYLKKMNNLPVQELIRIGMHISEAINSIWEFSKIHRDIKPGNIMRRASNGDFVLLDMGLVFDLQDESLSVSPVGTPLYFSPEQMDFTNRRTVMDFRSDLFSLGIVLYEMATGRHPFLTVDAVNTWEILGNIAKKNPTPPKCLRSDLPLSLNDVIMRLLAKRPALRYRSIPLFQRALQEVKF